MLDPSSDRLCLFPIRNNDIWEMYKSCLQMIWFVEEIDCAQDMKDWQRLNSNEQHFVKRILAFFAGSDGIVIENLAQRFLTDVQLPEARAFFASQILIEQVHSETYAVLIDTFVKDPDEKAQLFRAIETVPSIKTKADWSLRWITSNESFAERLVAFACVEGIFFSASFAAIFWLKKRGIMPGITFSNVSLYLLVPPPKPLTCFCFASACCLDVLVPCTNSICCSSDRDVFCNHFQTYLCIYSSASI